MFYSSEILNIKSNSNLGIVWLAATLGPKSNAKRLARKDLSSISITSTCSFLISPPEPLSLRLSANLMVGVSRVYGQQCQFHWSDVQSLCTKINHINKPANPEDIDLPNHEKKGNNITLKKIDCISAVNTLPGDPLNFPDLDISNLLLMSTEKGGRNSDISLSIAMNPEIGRKSMISTFGTPFSTSSSSNALQGSDFASALYDSDLAYSLNDHDIMHAPEYSLNSNEHFPFRPKNIMSDNMEFQVPNQVEKRRISRIRRIKNALMDMELMLGKDDLFINESEMLNYATKNLISEEADPIKEALNLLNCPDEPFVMETFDGIFKTSKLNFSYSKPMISKKSGSNNSAFTSDHIDFHDAEGHYEYYNNNDNFNEIEQYRNVPNSTPNTLNLPWSISGSGLSSSSMGLSSIGINTPIRKGQLNGQNSPTSLLDLQLSSTSSSSSISLYNPKNDMNLPQETFDFLYYLHDSMSSDSGINTLGRILNKETVSRPVVARAFHHLLELKSANLIDVKQSSPFSDIQIIMN